MQMDQAQNDEIDLFSIFETLWDGKWKIIFLIFISSIAGISISFFTPNAFKVTTKLKESNKDLYNNYKYLNNILQINNNQETKKFDVFNNYKVNTTILNRLKLEKTDFSNSEEFKVDNVLIFEMFINEFNDYEEMISVLSKNDFVKEKIKNLNVEDKRKALINFAKNFNIIKTSKKGDKSWQISFLWHEVSEGSFMFTKALNLTLNNVQKSLSKKIDNIANSIDLENQRKKGSLNIVLKSMRELNKLNSIKRIRYLVEQSDIAKVLGIEKNQLDKLNIESPNYPYYLRGFKAIDKELDLIKSRSNEDNDLMSLGYFEIKRELILIENDIRSKQLRDANQSIKKDDISKWVSFNLELAKVESIKKPNLYIFFSIILGGILGTFYVLIAEAFRKRKNI